jgi:hypothetical protein
MVEHGLFDFTSEVVIAFVADNTRWQYSPLASNRLRHDVLNAAR